MARMRLSTAWVAGMTLWQWRRHKPSAPKSGATGGSQMKTIATRLPDVEAAMLLELQKTDKDFRDLPRLILQKVRNEYSALGK